MSSFMKANEKNESTARRKGSSPSRPRSTASSSSPSSAKGAVKGAVSPQSECMTYSTISRLPDEDVRAIFECLHNCGPKPGHLHFSIVPVHANGLTFAPPPYEFGPGLYVLVQSARRPKQKKTSYEEPKPPPHLEHLVLRKQFSEPCPWQVSGPQFPLPTAIQQRYAYPKGNPEYSNRIGGAIWTMYATDGKEDVEYRLLHVYLSAKRAANKGLTLPSTMSESPPPKKTKRSKRSPNRHLDHSPAITNSSMSHTSLSCSSPSQGYEGALSPAPAQPYIYHQPYHHHFPHHQRHHVQHYGHHPHMPPIDQTGIANSPHSNKDVFRRYHQMEYSQMGSGHQAVPVASPLRRRPDPNPPAIRRIHPTPSDDGSAHQYSPPAIQKIKGKSQDSSDSKSSLSPVDPFDFDYGSLRDIDSYWNDPLLSIMLKPSQDKSASPTSSLPPLNQKAPDRTLMARLETLQLSIRELILQAPTAEEQEVLLSMVTTWARELAKDPLSDPMLSKQPSQESEGAETTGSSKPLSIEKQETEEEEPGISRNESETVTSH